MRLASKNEMLSIMGDRAPYFAAFCLSEAGAITKFLFDNADNYDLDLPVVQGMIAQLYAGGILDTACLERFAAFGQPEPVATPIAYYTYRVPSSYDCPPSAAVVVDTTAPDTLIITVTEPIPGLEVVS